MNPERIDARLAANTVRELAMKTHRTEEEVRQVFEDELAAADKDARVKTFVAVFAKRRTIERLRPGRSRH